jgi:hypothetical protein
MLRKWSICERTAETVFTAVNSVSILRYGYVTETVYMWKGLYTERATFMRLLMLRYKNSKLKEIYAWLVTITQYTVWIGLRKKT